MNVTGISLSSRSRLVVLKMFMPITWLCTTFWFYNIKVNEFALVNVVTVKGIFRYLKTNLKVDNVTVWKKGYLNLETRQWVYDGKA